MAVFAFVIGAVALAGLVLLTSRLAALALGWDSRLLEQRASIEKLRAAQERTSTATLRAELDDLRGALDVIRASNRRELGSLWAKVGGKPNGRIFEHDTGLPLAGDAELDAVIGLQSAKPVQPQ